MAELKNDVAAPVDDRVMFDGGGDVASPSTSSSEGRDSPSTDESTLRGSDEECEYDVEVKPCSPLQVMDWVFERKYTV